MHHNHTFEVYVKYGMTWAYFIVTLRYRDPLESPLLEPNKHGRYEYSKPCYATHAYIQKYPNVQVGHICYWDPPKPTLVKPNKL